MPTVTGRATDYITFSRASNATVTDSNGVIKWAGHNLLTNSESFDASAWTKSSATVTANTDPAPNGTTTGDTIAASGANGTALQTWTALAVPYTFAVWLKRKTGTGTIEIAADSGTYTAVTITSSWALYTVTQTPAAGSKSAGIRIVTSGDEVYAWGAHLYRSDLGGMVLNPARGDAYYPTTPRNLLGFTEDFSNAAWVKTNILAFGSGSISNAIVAPNGLQTADKIVSSTANNNHRVQRSVAGVLVTNTKYVFSFYAKAAEYTKVQIADAVYSVYSARFDLTGSGSVVASSGCTAAITPVGDGWYRCSAIYTSGGANAWAHISPYPDSGATFSVDGASYLGDGISGIYVWGAQLSDSASLDTYSPVYGAAVTSAAYYAPRLDFDPVTLAAKGLLVEEQRTNLALWSNDLTNAAWTASNVTPAKTAIGPDGTANSATTLTATAGNGTVLQAITSASAARMTSCYIKRRTGTGVIELTQNNGSTWTAVTVTSSWTRVNIASATVTNPTVGIRIVTSSDEVDVFAFQIENGAFMTSAIPTGAASATRSADVASVSTQAFPYSATEGSLIAAFTPVNVAAARRAAQLDDATENERITLGTNSTPNGLMTVIDGGSSQASIATGTPAANTTMKLASRYKLDDFAVSANGAAVGTDTSGTLPTMTTLRLGSGTSSTEPLNGWLRQITYIPRALTNAELVARST